MARPRKITKYGSSYVIKLIPQDMEDLDLEIKDEVDIEDIVKVKNEVKNGEEK